MAEVFAFPEGKLYLWPAYSGYWSSYLVTSATGSASASSLLFSANGTASGAAIGYARDASLTFAYGWIERYHDDGTWRRGLTAQYGDLQIGHLLSDQTLYNLANSKSAINAVFEGYVSGTQQTARWTLYSGLVDSLSVNQADGDLFNGKISYHAYEWTATGG